MPKQALQSAFRLVRDVQRDLVSRCFSPSVRASVIHATQSADEARRRFDIRSPQHAAILAHGVCASTSLASFQKGQERVAVGLSARGAELYTEAIRVGEVRGYLRGESSLRGDGTFDGSASGASFAVNKFLYKLHRPVSSSTPVSTGNVVDELREWYARSEQIPAIVHMEVTCESEDGSEARFINGILVQDGSSGHNNASDAHWKISFAAATVLELMPGGSPSELALAHDLLGHGAAHALSAETTTTGSSPPDEVMRRALRLPPAPAAAIDPGPGASLEGGSGGLLDGSSGSSSAEEASTRATAERWAEEEAQSILGRYGNTGGTGGGSIGASSPSAVNPMGPFVDRASLVKRWAEMAMEHREMAWQHSTKAAGLLREWNGDDILRSIQDGLGQSTGSKPGSAGAISGVRDAYPSLCDAAAGKGLEGAVGRAKAGPLEAMIRGCGATPQEVAGLLVPWGKGGVIDLSMGEISGHHVLLGGFPRPSGESSDSDEASAPTSRSEQAKLAEVSGVPQTTPLHYLCRCSKDGFLTRMSTLPEDDLKGMLDDGAAGAEAGEGSSSDETVAETLVCRVCNEHYEISRGDIKTCIASKHQQNTAAAKAGAQAGAAATGGAEGRQ